MESGESHNLQKSDGLQADRLSAGVRSRDHQLVKVFPQPDVDRNDPPAVNQRMACPANVHDPLFIKIRLCGVHFLGKDSPRKDEVQLRQNLNIGNESVALLRRLFAELLEDLLDLLLLLRLECPDIVVQLHDRHRLDENRLTGRTLVVDHARNLGAVLRPDREAVSAVPLGDDRVLKKCAGGSVHHLLQLRMDPLLRQADLTADPAKIHGRIVCNLIL